MESGLSEYLHFHIFVLIFFVCLFVSFTGKKKLYFLTPLEYLGGRDISCHKIDFNCNSNDTHR